MNSNILGHTTKDTKQAYGRDASRYDRYANGRERHQRRYELTDQIVHKELSSLLARISVEHPRGAIGVLDVGCGEGVWTRAAKRILAGIGRQGRVVGLDNCSQLLELAREKTQALEQEVGGLGLEFVQADLRQALPFELGEFHLTMSMFTVLNHLALEDELAFAACEMRRVTCTRGRHLSVTKSPWGNPTAYVADVSEMREVRRSGREILVFEKDGSVQDFPAHAWSQSQLVGAFEGAGWTDTEVFGIDYASSLLDKPVARAQFPEDAKTREEVVELDKLLRHSGAFQAIANAANHMGIVARNPG